MSVTTNVVDPLITARRVLEIESDAIRALIPRLGDGLPAACEICIEAQRNQARIVVIGLGKSGHVGSKIAATLASTGSPAFFVHAGEAGHGDMGMITGQDVILAISYSGETQEIAFLLPHIKRLGLPLIAMTGNPRSTLARAASVNLDISVAEEACPLNLAPTASTTAALAMGDALAIVLLEQRGFREEDFANFHPGGVLGRRLLVRVRDIMHEGGDIPSVTPETSVSDGLLEMSRGNLGITAVVDGSGRLCGVFTDGDLRRTLDRRIDIHDTPIGEVMTPGGKTVHQDDLAARAVRLMEDHGITALLVLDEENKLVGALNIHDVFRAGVV
ncbi:MAG: KpsF/GutQ family sugar-phosphate isomerase [Proteobacteria bacterium]|nr:KpsF/GutQ family sugar-phosphate isomerase [Pseudomonadota bacterium]MYJ95764.1 KpsF/GutQ family sugar-phosphate isomerase [Pseudomonadota bacterium]